MTNAQVTKRMGTVLFQGMVKHQWFSKSDRRHTIYFFSWVIWIKWESDCFFRWQETRSLKHQTGTMQQICESDSHHANTGWLSHTEFRWLQLQCTMNYWRDKVPATDRQNRGHTCTTKYPDRGSIWPWKGVLALYTCENIYFDVGIPA